MPPLISRSENQLSCFNKTLQLKVYFYLFCFFRLYLTTHTDASNSAGNASSSHFQAKIRPSQNGDAEKELSRNLCKSSFSMMEPIGQFNLGFIVARLEDDLFIVDQVS